MDNLSKVEFRLLQFWTIAMIFGVDVHFGCFRVDWIETTKQQDGAILSK